METMVVKIVSIIAAVFEKAAAAIEKIEYFIGEILWIICILMGIIASLVNPHFGRGIF